MAEYSDSILFSLFSNKEHSLGMSVAKPSLMERINYVHFIRGSELSLRYPNPTIRQIISTMKNHYEA